MTQEEIKAKLYTLFNEVHNLAEEKFSKEQRSILWGAADLLMVVADSITE